MIIAIVLAILNLFAPANANVVVIPPMPKHLPNFGEMGRYDHDLLVDDEELSEDELSWREFWTESYWDHDDQFTALFESYETKWSKNGRLMIRQGDSGSFKFAKKG